MLRTNRLARNYVVKVLKFVFETMPDYCIGESIIRDIVGKLGNVLKLQYTADAVIKKIRTDSRSIKKVVVRS